MSASAPPVLGSATVAAAMTPGVIHCAPETPLRAVARLMAERRVHAVYVLGDDGVLWGLVSDLDVVAAAETDLDAMTASGSAVAPLATVRSDDRLAEAARRMAETGVSHLAVLDPLSGRPSGVLSTLDVIGFIARA